MTIYSPITLTEKVIETFNPTRLYIKKLEGYYYFGQKRPTQSLKMKNKTWKLIDGKRVYSEIS